MSLWSLQAPFIPILTFNPLRIGEMLKKQGNEPETEKEGRKDQ